MLFTHDNRSLCCLAGQNGKCRRRKKRQAAKRTRPAPANGFLNHRFTPVMGRDVGLLGVPAQVEKAFYQSLRNLVAFYHLKGDCSSKLSYPMNIKQSFDKVEKAFMQQRTGLQVVILNDATHKACVATVKAYDTGPTLFYLPLQRLVFILGKRHKRRQADLLLSVCAYLLQVAGIPFFNDGFVGGEYDMIYEWYDSGSMDYDEADFAVVRETYRQKDYHGKKLLKSLRHSYHLQQFEARVKNFRAVGKKDKELLEVSKKLLSLYRQFPERSIMDNVFGNLIEPGEEERIYPDQYISFIWDGAGMVFDQLIESVNTSFQEMPAIEEPSAVQFFDRLPDSAQHDLFFEEQFFESLHLLADILFEL